MTLRWQIALALAAIAAFVGAAAATGAYVTTSNRLAANVDESLRSRVEALTSGGDGATGGGRHQGGPDGRDGIGDGCPDAGNLEPASSGQLVAADGTVTSCISGAPELPVAAADLTIRTGYRLRTVEVGGRRIRMVTARWNDDEVIQIGRDLTESTDVLASLRLKLAGVALGGALVASVVGWLLARRLTRPIVRLRDTAEAIARTQDLATPIPAGGSGEVGSLATSLTTMVAALRRSKDQQQRLVDDASHEMRTPLTSLTSNLEHLHHFEQLPAAEGRDVLEAVQADVGELTNLLAELVELATDRSVDDEPVELLDLAAIAREVAARTGRRTKRTVSVTADGPPQLVPARPSAVERAIANLLDNAVKYSPAATPIEVHVAGGAVEVRDHGGGIAAADQPHVFDRFYRAVDARSEPGSGLGLSIVRQIVERHGGRTWAGNAPDGGGASVGFELPTPRSG